MKKYTIDFVQNRQNKSNSYEASSPDLAYMKLMSEQPYAYVTKITDQSTGTECAIPNPKKEAAPKTNNSSKDQTPDTSLSIESIDKLANKIASSIPKPKATPNCRDLTELSIFDWSYIIFKINVAALIVMTVPVTILLILANS